MKKAATIASILLLVGVATLVWRATGTWSTVCKSDSPDGSLQAVIRCHSVPTLMDGREHYYLAFEPERDFRPIADADSVTVKTSASAVKNDQVVYEWKKKHYVGYLQGFDDLGKRRPSSVQWEADGTVTLLSQDGIAGQYEFKK